MATNGLPGNAHGIARLGRRSILVTMLAVLLVVAAPRCETSVAAAKDNERATGKATNVLDKVGRTIGKEPKYSHKPRYALIVLGTNADAKFWMVEDGESLYLDRNLNGDLTDDGPPIARTQSADLCDYKCRELTPVKGPKHTDFCLRRWNNGESGDSYGLSLAVGGKVPMYAGWFGTFWSSSPETVPIIQFGGPLVPTTLGQNGVFILGSKLDQLGIGFSNDGAGKGATSYLSIDALPKEVVPEVEIDWPVARGAAPIGTTERLTERCCYWNYYKKGFHVPAGVVEGEALLTIWLPKGEMPFPLASKQFKVPVRAKTVK